MKPSATRPNPYDSPADVEQPPAPKPKSRNRAAKVAMLLSLVLPVALLLSPSLLLAYPKFPVLVEWMRLVLFLCSPAAIFAVAFSIIGLYGRPSRYSVIALTLGGAECFLIVIVLMLTA
ncbi:MAG: hypothetical protein RIC55_03105 [Pirellulaceae bacterium]